MTYNRLGKRTPTPTHDDGPSGPGVAAVSATPNAERLARGRAAVAAARAGMAASSKSTQPPPQKPPAKRRSAAIRILPATAFVAALVLSFRVADLWENRQGLIETVSVGTVAVAEDTVTTAEPVTQIAAVPRPESAGSSSGQPLRLAQASDDRVDPFNLGKSQIELLQSLAERRRELEERERTLVQREGLLAAAEHRIEKKISELNGIKSEIEGLIKKYDEQEEQQLSSLVKIYETMKPKDAARIFDELDMDILLQVIQRMKASKTAPVLAKMTPERAKEVTARIAERRIMPDIN